MATQEVSIVTHRDKQRPAEDSKKLAREEKLLRVFGIVVLLLGLVAMLILRARTALPATRSDTSSLQKSTTQGTEDALEWLAWKLDLTRTQQQAVRPVVEQEMQARSALLQTPEVSTSEQEAQLVDLRNTMLAEIQPVLTDRQRTLVRELEQEGRS
jgi:hypothetical protein